MQHRSMKSKDISGVSEMMIVHGHVSFVRSRDAACRLCNGGDRFRLGHHKSGWRAVVDQQATLKADHTLIAKNRQYSMVA